MLFSRPARALADVPVFYSLLFIISMVQLLWSLICCLACAKKQVRPLARPLGPARPPVSALRARRVRRNI